MRKSFCIFAFFHFLLQLNFLSLLFIENVEKNFIQALTDSVEKI